MVKQKVLEASADYQELDEYLRENSVSKLFLVCDNAFPFLRLSNYFENLESRLGIQVVKFNQFKPNPEYESVEKGVALFLQENCDTIIVVGGGSAMDVAKCIKLYANMDMGKNFLEQAVIPNQVRLLAVPTTAGTGSEATRYAVIYYQGEKQSISDKSCIPGTVLMDASALKTLPDYQKKATMMDAFCHGVEALWSVNATKESKELSKMAIQAILKNKDGYLNNEDSGNAGMLAAANLAGQAINITQTTAGHAMCYKITSLYGIAHGHAAALCLAKLWPYMVEHTNQCVDPRGPHYLGQIFMELASVMGCNTAKEAAIKFQEIFRGLGLSVPEPKERDYEILRRSVNTVRMKNNPVALTDGDIDRLYRQIFHKGELSL